KEVPGTKFNDVRKVKGQPVGFITAAYYYLFEEEPAETEYSEYLPGFALKNWDYINIYASDFLWDLNDPLKYGLQNAFDGNPATSYVENTEDDMMKIEIPLGKPSDKMAIINGYAQSESLYLKNNRVKYVADYFLLKDNTLSYQYIPCRSTIVDFTEIYHGEKYNDTCIAEINYYFENHWLFGDINEQ
ncbi:MAG: hypothetical protein IKA80_01690, partial [Spirochaetaceae bacterium]|nr:hypothetical protein [Spirochaetaceae bacterium]